MKRIFLFSALAFSLAARSQNVVVYSGTQFIASGSPTIVLNNMGLDAAPNTTDLQNANLTVSGNANCLLKNSSAFLNLQKLTVDKPGAVLTIANDVQVYKGVQMVNGLFDIGAKHLYLALNSLLTGETETARITGSSSGFIETVVNFSGSNNLNAGGTGIYVTTAANTGLVAVRRGHKVQSGAGLASAVNRYYELVPANNTALNATLKFTYFDAELNNQTEGLLQPLESVNNGASWSPKITVSKDAAANYLTTGSFNSLYLYTLGTPSNSPLPVTGLEFFAKRIAADKVQLDWKTVQEISNKGFDVERKKDYEQSFALKNFVASKAFGGNSATPLNYALIDTNAYNGKTYYRIKQSDTKGSFVYSAVKVVDGNAKIVSLTAWPVPAAGFVNIRADGITAGVLQVWNAGGQLVKELPAEAGQTLILKGLAAGTYILRLKSNPDLMQRIVIR